MSFMTRPALDEVIAYQPGKPIEEVRRELGLDQITKLASNEAPYGPLPEALEALERTMRESNRYPDGGAWELRSALSERLGVSFHEVAIGAGADGIIDCLAQAMLDAGDGVVCGWPSFPSYVISALKMGARVKRVPLRDDRYDLDAMLQAVDRRTKLVFVCLPNNPTGTMNTASELRDFLDALPPHVLPVVDQAYFEYVDEAAYPDPIQNHHKAGRPVICLRTFSKIFGLAALRVGYAVGPQAVIAALDKVKRAFDVTSGAQAAALASLEGGTEIARRRIENTAGRRQLERVLKGAGLAPIRAAVANFVAIDLGADAQTMFHALLHEGVIVRPLHGFGAPEAIRITVGTGDEIACLDAAFRRLATKDPSSNASNGRT